MEHELVPKRRRHHLNEVLKKVPESCRYLGRNTADRGGYECRDMAGVGGGRAGRHCLPILPL